LPASSASLSSGCGASSFTCSVSLQPVARQSGQATLTVTAKDPYGQTAQSTLSVNIAAAKSGGGGGGAFDSCSLFILWMLLAAPIVRARTRCLPAGTATVSAGNNAL